MSCPYDNGYGGNGVRRQWRRLAQRQQQRTAGRFDELTEIKPAVAQGQRQQRTAPAGSAGGWYGDGTAASLARAFVEGWRRLVR